MQPNLGIVPAIPLIIKAVPAVIGILGGKKKQKAAERMAQYEMNAQQIAAGQAVMATDVMTEADKAFLRKVWPSIRVAASFNDPNWASIGYPAGPQLTPVAKAAITHAWPTVRVAANFDDVNWQYHAVPLDIVAPLLPLPELGYDAPAPPGTSAPAPTFYSPTQPSGRARVAQASLFPGLSTDTMIIMAAVGVGALILFSGRR